MRGSEGEKSTLFSIIWVSVTLFLRLLLETGLPFYIVIRPREGLAVCRDTAIPPFLSYFQTLSIGLALWIEPTASRFAVKLSTDRANPVVGGMPVDDFVTASLIPQGERWGNWSAMLQMIQF